MTSVLALDQEIPVDGVDAPFSDVPDEIVEVVLCHLTLKQAYGVAALVSHRWRRASESPVVRRHFRAAIERAQFAHYVAVPGDRIYDVQWNPPGLPELRCRCLHLPYMVERTVPSDRPRLNQYTFKLPTTEGSQEGSQVLCQCQPVMIDLDGHPEPLPKETLYNRVEWVAMNDSILFFLGATADTYGAPCWGTLIKGPNIPADRANGVYKDCKKPSTTEALAWLCEKFGNGVSAPLVSEE